MAARGGEGTKPSPLAGLLSSSSKLELPNWNDRLNFAAPPELAPSHTPGRSSWRLGAASRTPAGKTPGLPRTPGVNYGIRRVTQGATPCRTPALAGPRMLQGTPSAGLVAFSLQHLPNALEAEYWICKADIEEGQGNFEAAENLYQEALSRDVRPATAVTRAYNEFRARTHHKYGETSHDLPAHDGTLVEIGNRSVMPSTTPRKLAISGRAMRVPTPSGAQRNAASQADKGHSRVQFQTPGPPSMHAARIETPATAVPAAGTGRQQPAGQTQPQPQRRQSHVRFNTPEANVVATVPGSPAQRQPCNSCDAGSTPFRPGRTAGVSPFADLSDAAATAVEEDEADSSEAADSDLEPLGGDLTARLSAAACQRFSSGQQAERAAPSTAGRSTPGRARARLSDRLDAGIHAPALPCSTGQVAEAPAAGDAGTSASMAALATPANAPTASTAATTDLNATPAEAAGLLISAFAAASITDRPVAADQQRPSSHMHANRQTPAAGPASVTRFLRLDSPLAGASARSAAAAQQQQPAHGAGTPCNASTPAVAPAATPILMGAVNPLFNSQLASPSDSESGSSCFNFTPAALSAAHCRATPASLSSVSQALSRFALASPVRQLNRTPAAPPGQATLPANDAPLCVTPTLRQAVASRAATHAAGQQTQQPGKTSPSLAQQDSFGSPFSATCTPEAAALPTTASAAATPAILPSLAYTPSHSSDGLSTPCSPTTGVSARTPGISAFTSAGCGVSPELLGYSELQDHHQEPDACVSPDRPVEAAASDVADLTVLPSSPTPAVQPVTCPPPSALPRSAFKGSRMAAMQATPSGASLKPMRVQTPASRPRVGRHEVRSLLEGSFQSADQELGSTSLLSPVRTTSRLRSQLGTEKMMTPVRRSARGLTPAKPNIASILEETDFAYAPNELLPQSTRPCSATPGLPAAESTDRSDGPITVTNNQNKGPAEVSVSVLTSKMAGLAVTPPAPDSSASRPAKQRKSVGLVAGTPKALANLSPQVASTGSGHSRRKTRSRVSMSTTEANIREGLRRSARLRSADQQ